jgi:hypothetical protein
MAEPDWNRIAARELSQAVPQTNSDVWQKASIVASIFSSVVVAAVGIAVTYGVQRTQIASAEAISHSRIEAARTGLKANKDFR